MINSLSLDYKRTLNDSIIIVVRNIGLNDNDG